MRPFLIATTLATTLGLLAPLGSAPAQACTYEDTTYSNTGYFLDGPYSTDGRGENTDGHMWAYLSVASGQPSNQGNVWSGAADRINTARHSLSSGNWVVTWHFAAASASLHYTGANVQGVDRLGWQIERFDAQGNVAASDGDSVDVITAPAQGDNVPFPAGEYAAEIDGGYTYDALFFVNAYGYRPQGSSIDDTISWLGTSVCWYPGSLPPFLGPHLL